MHLQTTGSHPRCAAMGYEPGTSRHFPVYSEVRTLLRRETRLDDAALVERALGGDQGAYAHLVRRYQQVAFRVAFLVTGSATDAEDAAQNGFIKAFGALSRFDRARPFRPWLLRVVANEARNGVRSRIRYEDARLTLSLQPKPTIESPEDSIVADESKRILLRTLNGMKEIDRMVLACRYLLDLSEAETAHVLDCRVGTVKSRTARALRRLRVELPASVESSGATDE